MRTFRNLRRDYTLQMRPLTGWAKYLTESGYSNIKVQARCTSRISPRTFFKETARASFSSANRLLKKLQKGRYSGCGVGTTAKRSTTNTVRSRANPKRASLRSGRRALSRAQNQYIRAGYQSWSALRATCLQHLLPAVLVPIILLQRASIHEQTFRVESLP